MSFEEEKNILSKSFSKSFVQLCAKYNISGMPEDIISDVMSKVINRKLVRNSDGDIHPEEQELPDEDGSEMDTDESGNSSSPPSNSSGSSASESDESDFVLVEKKRRRANQQKCSTGDGKKSRSAETTSTKQHVPTNPFHLLQPKEKEPSQVFTEQVKVPRPPPLICYNLNVAEFRKKLEKLPTRPKFFIKNTNKTRCIIKPATEEDRQVLFKTVQDVKVDCYTFTPKEERKISLVLRGIQCSFTPEEVHGALEQELPHQKIARVTRLTTHKTKEKGPINAFVVTFEKDTDIQEVIKVNRLLHQVIHWEKYRSPGISQCKNCQAYGHVASNCGKQYKCMKCNEQHGPKECKRDPEVGQPFCINCGKFGHPANYRGCPKYKGILEARRTAQEERRQREQFVQTSARNYVQSGKSFADVLSNKTNHVGSATRVVTNNNTNKSKQASIGVDDFCTKEAKSLFGCDLFGLMAKINAFLPSYRKLTSVAERQSAYLQFAFSLCASRT